MADKEVHIRLHDREITPNELKDLFDSVKTMPKKMQQDAMGAIKLLLQERVIKAKTEGRESKYTQINSLMKNYWKPLTGLVLIIGFVFLAFLFPVATKLQSTLIWVGFAIGATLIAILFTGDLKVKVRGVVATGVFGFFILLYIFKPWIADLDNGVNRTSHFDLVFDDSTFRKLELEIKGSSQAITTFCAKTMAQHSGRVVHDSDIIVFNENGSIMKDELCTNLSANSFIVLFRTFSNQLGEPHIAFNKALQILKK